MIEAGAVAVHFEKERPGLFKLSYWRLLLEAIDTGVLKTCSRIAAANVSASAPIEATRNTRSRLLVAAVGKRQLARGAHHQGTKLYRTLLRNPRHRT